jgi:tagatose-1,6-bisphosphate aldolase non-catalytic subunit AgaZ/GatZ
VEMLQPLGGHHIGDRITVGQENAHGWVEIAADLVDEYVAAQYIKVVSP